VIVREKKILRIDVPAADRHDKPVYIGTDPMKGTYKRDYEGDFLWYFLFPDYHRSDMMIQQDIL